MTVKFVDPTQGILFSSDHGDCFAHASKLSQDKKPSDFKRGSSYTGRVIGFDMLDSLHVVSLEPSVLKAPFIDYSGLQPGMVVKGEILKVADYGLLVQLADNIRAICPLFHLSDHSSMSKSVLSKFKANQKMSFRVLEVDPEAKKLTLCRRRNMNNV